jgi:anti-anti-sigma regulatory factor
VHCRIQVRREDNRVVVHLAGRLAGREVPELLEACTADEPPILELDELVSADAVGLDALVRIEASGVQLTGVPEYIRLKLNVLAGERRR